MKKNKIRLHERVFDCERMLAAYVKDITVDETTGQTVYTLVADDEWNRKYMDIDAENEPATWTNTGGQSLYRFVPDKVDARCGYDICYEHTETKDNYSYYCPVIDENLFEIETVSRRKWNKS